MPSPVRVPQHSTPQVDLCTWLGNYRTDTPGVVSGIGPTVFLDRRNQPQPDNMLMVEQGGRAAVDEEGYLRGGPELVAEVSASTARADRRGKFPGLPAQPGAGIPHLARRGPRGRLVRPALRRLRPARPGCRGHRAQPHVPRPVARPRRPGRRRHGPASAPCCKRASPRPSMRRSSPAWHRGEPHERGPFASSLALAARWRPHGLRRVLPPLLRHAFARPGRADRGSRPHAVPGHLLGPRRPACRTAALARHLSAPHPRRDDGGQTLRSASTCATSPSPTA